MGFYYALFYIFEFFKLNTYIQGWLTFIAFCLGLLILVRKLVFKN